jgi:putative nucleotidyltransferase with HDIG domain
MAYTDSEALLEKIAAGVSFAAMPEVLSRLMILFDDPNASSSEVAEILSKDAGLVTRVLRVANSAYYGGLGEVATVQQALVKLGFRTTKAVVLSSAVYSSVNRSAPAGIDLRPFWQHGLEVGVTAMLLADEVCGTYTDECFVAGLLHDLGRAALACAFPGRFQEWLKSPSTSWTLEAEQQAFGVNHADVGAHMCRRWQFPELLVNAVALHHSLPDALPADPRDRIAVCVGLANAMSLVSWAGPSSARTECRQYRERAARLVGLDAERLQVIASQAAPEIEEWAQLLEIEVCPPGELLARANDRLFALYQAMDKLHAENEELHARLLAEEHERASLEALKVICATFSHHINNATTTILGRAQLVGLAVGREEKTELSDKIGQSMKVIENAVDTITEVLGELKCLTRFDTTSYHGRAEILKLRREVSATP